MYICNITGKSFDLEDNEKCRESFVRFGFNSRFRALSYVFTKLFYGECKILCNLEHNKNLKGIGTSEYISLAQIFYEKFNFEFTGLIDDKMKEYKYSIYAEPERNYGGNRMNKNKTQKKKTQKKKTQKKSNKYSKKRKNYKGKK